MNQITTVSALTYETRHVTADQGQSPFSYRRVAGIELDESRRVLCRGIGNLALSRELLPFRDATQAARFIYYFNRVIAPNDVNLPNARQRQDADYNCHDFAEFVAGDGIRRGWAGAVDNVERYTAHCMPLDGRLGLGARGFVVGTYSGHQEILHSFIGLGEDTNYCLSVLCVGGPLAIARLWHMSDDYIPAFPQLATLGKAPNYP